MHNMDKPAVHVLHLASGDLWAGAEVQTCLLCQKLEQEEEIVLSVVLLNEGELAERLRAEGVDVVVLPEAQMHVLKIYLELARLCRQKSIDLIHSHRQKENVLAALCRLFPGIPSIRTAHGAPEFAYKRLSLKNVQVFMDYLAARWLQHRTVAVSDDLRKKLRKTYPDAKLATVLNGIAPEANRSCNPELLGSGDIHIGIVGRLVPVKRIDLFLRMAAKLVASEQYPRVRFWVIGDGPLRVESEELARELGVADRVNFTGHIDSALPYLQSLDALIMCSDHEGTPMTILEAMQSGCPVIAHDVGGLRELLDNGRCGGLVSAQEPGAYAEAVQNLLKHDALRADLVAAAKLRVSESYNIEQTARDYIELYSDICGSE